MALRKVQKYEENPFAASLAATMRYGRKTIAMAATNVAVVNTDTGEEEDTQLFLGMKKVVDRTEFVKIYKDALINTFGLSRSAIGVFNALLNIYEETNTAQGRPDHIYFHYLAAQRVGYDKSKQTFQKGLTELVDKQFIAPDVQPDWYWINPNVFFKGDRLRFYTEYAVKDTKAARRMIEAARKLQQQTLPLHLDEHEED